MIVTNFVIPKAGAEHELLFNKPAPCVYSSNVYYTRYFVPYTYRSKCNRNQGKRTATEASLADKKLRLSSSFSCDQIYNCQRFDFGHT